MPMVREDHENLLNELLTPDLNTSRQTDILQLLRTDYATVITDHETLTTANGQLQANNDDLIVSNSKLFRQLGVVGGSDDDKKKEDEKSYSETITLEALEK